MRDKYVGIAALIILSIGALVAQADFAKEVVTVSIGVIAAFIRD